MSKVNNSTSLGLNHNSDYKRWLKDLKQKVQQTQIKATVQVNTTLLTFYWELGADIVQRQSTANWGDGFLKQLSKDLMKAFPDIKGFSERNLKYIRQWFLFYSQGQAIGQQAVAQLAQVPWGHNLQIIQKPIGVSEYQLTQSLPENLQSQLPSVEEIELELGGEL